MRLIKNILIAATFGSLVATAGVAKETDIVKEGKKIFNTKKLGNCLACHAVNGKDINNPGSFGPKLQGLSAWPEDALYQKIYDPYTTNPISAMPAFGKNGWLDNKQIKALVAYLKTVK